MDAGEVVAEKVEDGQGRRLVEGGEVASQDDIDGESSEEVWLIAHSKGWRLLGR